MNANDKAGPIHLVRLFGGGTKGKAGLQQNLWVASGSGS
jgi:hypothetical protein